MKIELPEEMKIPGCDVTITDNMASGRLEIKARMTTIGVAAVTQEAVAHKREGQVIDLMVLLTGNAQECAMQEAARIIANEKPNILIAALVGAKVIQPETLSILKYWNGP